MNGEFGRQLVGDTRVGVTFGMFKDVAQRRELTIESLASEFRGKIDSPTSFFERVFEKNPESRATVIPYASVLVFYHQEAHYLKDSDPDQRVCACGCGVVVFGGRKWAGEACRTRGPSRQVTDPVLEASK